MSRSYGVILPSSLTRVLSYTLGGYLLVYLCWTAVRSRGYWLGAFLGSMKSGASSCDSPSRLEVNETWIYLRFPLDAWTGTTDARHTVSFSTPPSLITQTRGTGILTCWPLSTPFGLDLGPTNPGRTSLPQETLDFR